MITAKVKSVMQSLAEPLNQPWPLKTPKSVADVIPQTVSIAAAEASKPLTAEKRKVFYF